MSWAEIDGIGFHGSAWVAAAAAGLAIALAGVLRTAVAGLVLSGSVLAPS